MPLLRPPGDNPAPSRTGTPEEQALYDMAFEGRGQYTNLLAGFLHDYAVEAHTVTQWCNRKLMDKSLSEGQQVVLKIVQALAAEERNKFLDKFFHQWTPAELRMVLDSPPTSEVK